MKCVSKKIKVGDLVKVISGSNKGSSGKIKSIRGDRAIVDSVGYVTIHRKKNKNSVVNSESGRIRVESSIHISNLINFSSGSASRIGFLLVGDQNNLTSSSKKVKFRILKTSGNRID